MKIKLFIISAALLGARSTFAAQPLTPTESQNIAFFEQNIRPLLAEKCYACHSAKSSIAQGGLRLDTRAGWMQGGVNGAVILPGNADKSRLIQAVRHSPGIAAMPPTGKLSEKEIALLTEWVKRGAPDPRASEKTLGANPSTAKASPVPGGMDIAQGRKHWAFQPLKRTPTPTVKNAAWCRNPIDFFVLSKQEQNRLAPNPQADKRVLIRRAYFDVVGLPPTPQEVEAFVNDATPNAYEKMIDRLLANPHYGERWGRHWLDLARFAESHGYEQDYDRPHAYHYRDFVIKALNQDMPFNQFVQWQLAGDEIAPNDPLALMATGFLGAGTHATQITKNQVEKERYDELDDMTATTGVAMLGLTVGCARCHNHKYDPIPNQDYYRLLSTFTTTVRSDMDVDIDPEGYKRAKAKFDAQHAPLAADLSRYEREELPAKLEAWIKTPASKSLPPEWLLPKMLEAKSAGGATFAPQPDGSLLATGKNPDFDTYTITVGTGLKHITGFRLEALADATLVKNGPGRAPNGNFALTDIRVTAKPTEGAGTAREIKLHSPRATFEQAGLPIAATIDNDAKSAWAIDPQFGKDHAAAFLFDAPVDFANGVILTFTLKFENNAGHNIGRPRLSLSTSETPLALNAPVRFARVESALALRNAGQAISEPERNALLIWYRTQDADWRARNKAVQEHLALAPKPNIEKVMVCSEGVAAIRTHTQGGDFLEQTYFLKRGDPNQKQGIATQSFLQVLMRDGQDEKHWQTAPPTGWHTSYRRRALADWITDVDNGAGGLLSRVIVNRLWQHHFGRGIVSTPSDFGTQGDRPTHPELLDWLATELIKNNWQLKPLHKLMLCSAAYRQSSLSNPQKQKLDPDNKLIWRHPRQRVEAEIVRDNMLSVSGLLDTTMFGPGSLDEGMTRRSIYFTIKRSRLIPTLRLFDGPDSLQSIGARQVTTVAPQALMLMNSPNARQYAARFAQRAAPNETMPHAEAIRAAYLLALSRSPAPAELTDALAFLEQQAASYQTQGQNNAAQLALTDFCQALFGLNEFVYVE